MIKEMLKNFKFLQEMPLNYDINHVIYDRRLANDRYVFQQNPIPDLRKEANSLEHDFIWSIQEEAKSIQTGENTNLTQVQSSEEQSAKKRPLYEVTDMEIKQQEETKKQKIVTGKEIIDIDQIEISSLSFQLLLLRKKPHIKWKIQKHIEPSLVD